MSKFANISELLARLPTNDPNKTESIVSYTPLIDVRLTNTGPSSSPTEVTRCIVPEFLVTTDSLTSKY